MASKQTIQYLIIAGSMVWYVAAQNDCDPINLALSTQITTNSGLDMTYVDRSTNITCNFTCNITCTKAYLYWRKDGQTVYTLDLAGNSSGPANGYEDRVGVVTKDDENGIYVMEWMDTNWDDTLGQDYASWDCSIVTDICRSKLIRSNVEYYKFSELVMYADEDPVDDYDALKAKGKGTANCSVISHPDSRITMLQRDVVLPDASSCSPFSQHESICSVAVDVDFIDGFECKVTYNSPETGAYEEVIPDGPSPGGLYPPTTSGKSLEGWEIALIVIGCLAAVGLLVGGVIYYKKHQGSGASD